MSKTIFLTIVYVFVLVQTQLLAETFDLDKASTASLQTGKKPLVYLHRTGCPYCNLLEEFTLDDDRVQEYIQKNFNFIVLNVSHTEDKVIYKNNSMTPREFAIEVEYNFFPSVLFLDTRGDLEHASVGFIEDNKFLLILKYMKTGAYKKMSIEQYKKKIGFQEEEDMNIDKRQKL
ncbi:MAG: thioredoxin fold domain-containing protein [Sulfurimonas sp.]